MSDSNTAAVTLEQVTELINSTVNGLAARQQKEFVKMLTPLSEQLTGFTSTIEGLKTQPTATKLEEGQTQNVADPRVLAMEKELKDIKVAREADQQKAAKLERENALGKALGSYTFANDFSRDTAFKAFDDMTKGSDDKFYVGDSPLEVAAKTRMENLKGLLAPKAVGGSGASSVDSQTAAPLEFKPNMTMAEMQAIATEAINGMKHN